MATTTTNDAAATTSVPHSSDDVNMDYRIIATGEDAILAKHATAHAKYYRDPFVEPFANANIMNSNAVHRRRPFQPLIKRGTHARVCCMDRAITSFLKTMSMSSSSSSTSTSTSCSDVEIVVLGAGKDTSYFRYITKSLMGMEDYRQQMQSQSPSSSQSLSLPKVHWYEVDHPSVIQEKAKTIQQSSMLSQCCPDLKETKYGYSTFTFTPRSDSGNHHGNGTTSMHNGGEYHLVGIDLRESPSEIVKALNLSTSTNDDNCRPTLFLVECVLMYMPEETTRALLSTLTSFKGDNAWIAMYEPILMGGAIPIPLPSTAISASSVPSSSSTSTTSSTPQQDAFGRMMEQNLVKAQVATTDSALLQTRTLQTQMQKLVDCGFIKRVVGCDMLTAYETIVTPEQRLTANQAEFMDELEEWILIMKHYAFVVGTTATNDQWTKVTIEKSPTTTPSTVNTSSMLGFVAGKCLVLGEEREDQSS